MIANKYLELIHKDIDKVITPQEKEVLSKYLASNADAEELYNELKETENLLDTLPKAEPSENLKKRILNSIDYNRYVPEKKQSILAGLFKGKRPGFALGIATLLILIGLFISNPNLISTFDQKDVSGTMGLYSAKEVAMLDIESEGVTGTIQVIKGSDPENAENNFGFSVELKSAGSYDLEITFDPSRTAFEEIINGDNLVTGRRDDAVIISSGGISLYSILFSSAENSGVFNLKLSSEGTELYRQKVVIK
jgi:hypothetical protein